MPTARELLEQADALMRRNRGRESEPDIPELTDEVAVAGGASVATRRAIESLTTALESQREADDVPELTDAVARIEEVLIEAPPDEGVDSRWLESELGGASITGPAPDSIAVVPPSTLRPAEPAANEFAPPERPPWRSDEHKLAPEAAAAVLASTLASPLAPRGEAPSGAADPAFDAMLGLRPAEVEFERELAPASPSGEEVELPADVTEAPADVAEAPADVAEAPADVTEAPADVAEAPADVAEAPADVTEAPADVAEAPADVAEAPADVAEAPADVTEVLAASEAADEARDIEEIAEASATAIAEPGVAAESVPIAAPSWDVIAEDIRMQVLQRIDIFTDTGLQGELAARLQPVVDRASADLIATINREVGQLLRAYVAEAIEREIEKWRESNP